MEMDSAIEADPLHSELRILDWILYQVCSNEIKKIYNISWTIYFMASEYCLTCGHTKNSHVFVEEQHVLKDGEKSSNYCKVKPCDCKQFRI
jgi:hypothetical protein